MQKLILLLNKKHTSESSSLLGSKLYDSKVINSLNYRRFDFGEFKHCSHLSLLGLID